MSTISKEIQIPNDFVFIYSSSDKLPNESKSMEVVRKPIVSSSTFLFPNAVELKGLIIRRFYSPQLFNPKTSKFIQTFCSIVDDSNRKLDLVRFILRVEIQAIFSMAEHSNRISPRQDNIYLHSTLREPLFLAANFEDADQLQNIKSVENNLEYPFKSGIVFIINTHDLSKTENSNIEDLHKLKRMFANMNFKKFVEIRNNPFPMPAEFITELMVDLAVNAHLYDCFALVILTNPQSKFGNTVLRI